MRAWTLGIAKPVDKLGVKSHIKSGAGFQPASRDGKLPVLLVSLLGWLVSSPN